MASVKKIDTKGGTRWRLRCYIGRDGEGKRQYVTRTFDKKKDADREANRLERQKDVGILVTPSKEPLAKYLRRWLDEVKKGQLRARTWADYSGVLKRYLEEPADRAPPVGRVRLDRLTPQAIQSLYAWLRDDLGLSPRTIRSVHAVVRQGLAYAFRTGAVARNVAELAELPKLERRKVEAMSAEEAEAFLKASRADRYHALWCVLLSGGLRPGEALGLTWGDVDLDTGKIHVQRALTRRGAPKVCACGHERDEHEDGGACGHEDCGDCEGFHLAKGWKLVAPKTARSRRAVALPSFAVSALKSHRAAQAEERLLLGTEYQDHGFAFATEFGAPLSLPNLYGRNYRRICAAAGLGRWEEVEVRGEKTKGTKQRFSPTYRLYDLRHTAATLLMRAGVHPKAVSERLGHSTVAFTLDTYSASLPDMQEAAAEKLEAMLGG